ncbi:MAG TPA: oligoendopeptidase F, partial [Bacillota bacterium]|nr:oligoendopeptidase F [Bacillota bacterium]
MSETTKELLSREEVPEEQTWKLEDIFETDELWEKEYEQLQKDIPQIGKFRGKIAESSGNLY